MPEHSDKPATSGSRVSPVQMQKHLKGTSYPASKDDLIRQAKGNHASDEIIETIRQLPADRFGSPKDVMKALGHKE